MEQEKILRTEYMGVEDRKALQEILLTPILENIINHTPAYYEYRHLLSGLNRSNSIDILRNLPLLSKNEIRLNPDSYVISNIEESLREYRTGGTSGEPLVIHRSPSEQGIEHNFVSASWERMGVNLGEDRGVVLTGRRLKNSEDGWTHHGLNEILWISCIDHSLEQWARVHNAVMEYRPSYIRGWGSLVSQFFRQLSILNLSLPNSIKGIAYSSDAMTHQEKEMIRIEFSPRLISLYGQTERVVMGVTCEKADRYHLFPSYGFTELVREDGSIIEHPGETGEIVGTSLFPRAMSFVRYRTGDLASWAEEGVCECGRLMPTFEFLAGRNQDRVSLKNGMDVILTLRDSYHSMMAALPSGVGAQFEQRDPGALHVFIHSVNHSDDDLAESLVELSVDFEVTHEFVEQPILNPNGKRTLLLHPSRIAE